jgi:hypothetical protein
MSYLDAKRRIAGMNEIGHASEWSYLVVAPQIYVEVVDARFRRISGALDEDERSPTESKLTKVDRVPVA